VVREVAVSVLAHRIIAVSQGAQSKSPQALIEDILQTQRTPQ
jgi:hypothetical protein